MYDLSSKALILSIYGNKIEVTKYNSLTMAYLKTFISLPLKIVDQCMNHELTYKKKEACS